MKYIFSLFIILCFSACSTVQRWNRELAMKEQKIVLQCQHRGGNRVITQEISLGHKVYWCCDEDSDSCTIIDER